MTAGIKVAGGGDQHDSFLDAILAAVGRVRAEEAPASGSHVLDGGAADPLLAAMQAALEALGRAEIVQRDPDAQSILAAMVACTDMEDLTREIDRLVRRVDTLVRQQAPAAPTTPAALMRPERSFIRL